MTGGKRLSEEERKDIVEEIEHIASFLCGIYLYGSASRLRKISAMLKSDDEPECCAWRYSNGEGESVAGWTTDCGMIVDENVTPDEGQFCWHCGKPVKEE